MFERKNRLQNHIIKVIKTALAHFGHIFFVNIGKFQKLFIDEYISNLKIIFSVFFVQEFVFPLC